jgi:hypothetical protein
MKNMYRKGINERIMHLYANLVCLLKSIDRIVSAKEYVHKLSDKNRTALE